MKKRFVTIRVVGLAALLVCVIGGGCGGGGGKGEILSTLPQELTPPLCNRMLACCTQKELEEFSNTITDQASCEVYFRQAILNEINTIKAAKAAGRVLVDTTHTEACIAAFDQQTCGELALLWSANSLACVGVTGQVAINKPCGGDLECQAGFCEDVCTAYKGNGDGCADTQCGTGLFCEQIGQTCVPQKADGVVCAQAEECRSGACRTGATPNDPSTCSAAAGFCDGQ